MKNMIEDWMLDTCRQCGWWIGEFDDGGLEIGSPRFGDEDWSLVIGCDDFIARVEEASRNPLTDEKGRESLSRLANALRAGEALRR